MLKQIQRKIKEKKKKLTQFHNYYFVFKLLDELKVLQSEDENTIENLENIKL